MLIEKIIFSSDINFIFVIILFFAKNTSCSKSSYVKKYLNRNPPPASATSSSEEPIKLESFRVHEDKITLSGFSSGGTFAQQMLVSYSSLFSGIGVFSHTFYRCGPGNGVEEDYDRFCTIFFNTPRDELWKPENAVADIRNYHSQNLIENPTNLLNKKLYVYAGTNSFLFSTDQHLRILNVFEPLIANPESIFTRVQAANLSLPTNNFGVSCPQDSSDTLFIANCGISGPYDALKFLLSDRIVQKPESRRNLESLQTFDQTEFLPSERHDMDTVGFIYIPQKCKNSPKDKCYLHFYFHGCLTGRQFVGDRHIRESGYLELAEMNGIIMVFPQAVNSTTNEIGCWDTYGFTSPLFATQKGAQVTAVRSMLSRLLKKSSNSASSSSSSFGSRSNFPSRTNFNGGRVKFSNENRKGKRDFVLQNQEIDNFFEMK